MKLKGNTIPGQHIWEYFLIISLPNHLKDEILELRQQFHERFSGNYRIKGVPTLALAHFLQYEYREEKIVTRLHELSSFRSPIHVHLNDFGSFPPKAIHISIDKQSAIHALAHEINTRVKDLLRINRDTKPMMMTSPHIGIIRKLSPEMYEQAWQIYKDRVYQRSFVSEEMILLRRIYGTKAWHKFKQFPFENKPKPTLQQGTLF